MHTFSRLLSTHTSPSCCLQSSVAVSRSNSNPNPNPDRLGNFSEISLNEDATRS